MEIYPVLSTALQTWSSLVHVALQVYLNSPAESVMQNWLWCVTKLQSCQAQWQQTTFCPGSPVARQCGGKCMGESPLFSSMDLIGNCWMNKYKLEYKHCRCKWCHWYCIWLITKWELSGTKSQGVISFLWWQVLFVWKSGIAVSLSATSWSWGVLKRKNLKLENKAFQVRVLINILMPSKI